MTILQGKGVLAKFDQGGNVVRFAVFDAPPVSDSREPDAVYTKSENGWVSESGDELSAEDIAELDARVVPAVQAEPTPDGEPQADTEPVKPAKDSELDIQPAQ
jgi:hypothetical protein